MRFVKIGRLNRLTVDCEHCDDESRLANDEDDTDSSHPFFVETNMQCSGVELDGDPKLSIDVILVDPKRKFGFVAGDLDDAIAHLFFDDRGR